MQNIKLWFKFFLDCHCWCLFFDLHWFIIVILYLIEVITIPHNCDNWYLLSKVKRGKKIQKLFCFKYHLKFSICSKQGKSIDKIINWIGSTMHEICYMYSNTCINTQQYIEQECKANSKQYFNFDEICLEQ